MTINLFSFEALFLNICRLSIQLNDEGICTGSTANMIQPILIQSALDTKIEDIKHNRNFDVSQTSSPISVFL